MSQPRQPTYYGQSLVPGPQRGGSNRVWILLLVGGVGVALLMCLVAAILIVLSLASPEPPAPATALPVVNPTAAPPLLTVTPTFNAVNAGQFFNPYDSANLGNMRMIQIDLRDSGTGNYVEAARVTGNDLGKFADAFNVSVKTITPDPNCVDHVRFTITRADESVITFSGCLKGVVILRGNLPDLNGADAPMYPGLTDALAPYLSTDLRSLLDF